MKRKSPKTAKAMVMMPKFRTQTMRNRKAYHRPTDKTAMRDRQTLAGARQSNHNQTSH